LTDNWTFNFRPKQSFDGKPITIEDAEKHFLAKLKDPNENHKAVRLELMRIYRSMGRVVEAMSYAEEYLAETQNVEEKAEAYFTLGQAMERIDDFESAVRFYMLALELEPRHKFQRYFIRNNIGFSLNQLDRYLEAEKYLCEAIAIDTTHANAYKNLGMCLAGQERYAEAAKSFISAVQANASDSRALRHLEKLAEQHKAVFDDFPDLKGQIRKCREAVAYAADSNNQNS
jgi:tetratricopeptide (TPR) repeat protein